jgi:hypothetical protein
MSTLDATAAEEDRGISGQRVAAEHERQVHRRGQRVDEQQPQTDAHVAAPEAPAAVEERLDRDDRRPPEQVEAQRRPFDGSGGALRLGEQRDRPRLDDERADRAADEHQQSGGDEGGQGRRALHQ